MTPTPDQARDAFFNTILIKVIAQVGDHGPMLPGTTLYHLQTEGLAAYKRPEMEIVDVPAMFVEGAGEILNRWAYYTVHDKTIKAGDRLHEGLNNSVLVRAVEIEGRLRLVTEAVRAMCACCDEQVN